MGVEDMEEEDFRKRVDELEQTGLELRVKFNCLNGIGKEHETRVGTIDGTLYQEDEEVMEVLLRGFLVYEETKKTLQKLLDDEEDGEARENALDGEEDGGVRENAFEDEEDKE